MKSCRCYRGMTLNIFLKKRHSKFKPLGSSLFVVCSYILRTGLNLPGWHTRFYSIAAPRESRNSRQKLVKRHNFTGTPKKRGILRTNKTGTSKVGAISKAQKPQSFLNMPRMYSWKALETLSRHPKCAFHARYDWKITFPDWKQKNFENFFEKNFFEFFWKKLRKRRIVPKNEKGGPFGIH